MSQKTLRPVVILTLLTLLVLPLAAGAQPGRDREDTSPGLFARLWERFVEPIVSLWSADTIDPATGTTTPPPPPPEPDGRAVIDPIG